MVFWDHYLLKTVMLVEIGPEALLRLLVAMFILLIMVQITVLDIPTKVLVLVEWLAHKENNHEIF
jgi:hypothetical protein